jgi:hypothetical protein
MLITLVLLLPMSYFKQQGWAQTSESIKLLVTDAIEDLQNSNTDSALTHSNLALREAVSSNGSSSVESARVLLNDVIQDLHSGDTSAALIHLNLAGQLLGVSSSNITSGTSNVNATSDGTVKSLASGSDNSDNSTTQVQDSQLAALNMTSPMQNATIALSKGECADNNFNGRCGAGSPISHAAVCLDSNQDYYCDWFKPVKNGTSAKAEPQPQPSQPSQPVTSMECYNDGLKDGKNHVYRPERDSDPECQQGAGGDYFVGFSDGCEPDEVCGDIAANATNAGSVTMPIPESKYISPVTGSEDFECQSDDDFCEPGCEYEDMVCLYGENDKNMDGIRDSQKNSGSNTSSFNGTTPRCIDNNLDGQCDIKWEAPSQGIRQRSQGVWMRICTSLQSALMSSCTALVNSDGTLTYEGNRAVGCIRNGALLAAAAGFNEIPLEWIIGGLQALEGPTGCSGIVNWKILNQLGSMNTILNLVQGSPS